RDTDVIFNRESIAHPLDGFKRLGAETINPQAWALDAAVWTLGEGAFGAGNALTKGALAKNQVLSGMTMGTTFGMVSGGAGEIMREKQAGQNIDWLKVGKQSLLEGTINGLAAGPGMKAGQMFAPKAAPPGPGNPDTAAVRQDPEIARR